MANMTGMRKVFIKNNVKRGRLLKRWAKNLRDLMVVNEGNQTLEEVLSQEIQNPVLVLMFPNDGIAHVFQVNLDENQMRSLGWKFPEAAPEEVTPVAEVVVEPVAEVKPKATKAKKPAPKKKVAKVTAEEEGPTDQELAEIEASLANLEEVED